ncbi:MAG: HmuY family protein [Paludibacteraceae bacterium]|nr:HmuY family protein [Paludibacteraceae bacterium]
MYNRNMCRLLLALSLVAGTTSCDGLFDGIYDDEVPAVETGMQVGQLTVDATSYGQWVYIDFHNKTIQNVDITTDSVSGTANFTEPDEWDIAIHRFQVKTNNGSAIETVYTSIDDLKKAGQLPDSTFMSDTWYDKKVITDLSGMMSGNIKYCPSYVNDIVGRWITSSGMPPTYTTSEKVYVICLEDGSYAALHFDSYMDNEGTKGYITCSYEYPLTF